MTTVRLATLGDITRLVLFGRIAHAHSNYADIPFNATVLRENLRQTVLRKGQDTFMAERKDGSVCGLLIAVTASLPFSRRNYATDMSFYAEQGGGQLLRAFLAWAQSHHVARVDMGVSQADPERRLDKLYEAHGMQPMGGMYLLKFPTTNSPNLGGGVPCPG